MFSVEGAAELVRGKQSMGSVELSQRASTAWGWRWLWFPGVPAACGAAPGPSPSGGRGVVSSPCQS